MIKKCIICGEKAHIETYFNNVRGQYLAKVNCSNPNCEDSLYKNKVHKEK